MSFINIKSSIKQSCHLSEIFVALEKEHVLFAVVSPHAVLARPLFAGDHLKIKHKLPPIA